MPPKRKAPVTVEELQGQVLDGLKRAVSRPSIFGYKPHEKQVAFHSNPCRGRLYIGGNRSGKTVGGVVEDIWRLRGKHPYKAVPEAPIRGRVVTTSYEEGVNKVIIPEFQKWLPPSELIDGSWEASYSKQGRTLTLANGSTCEFMSYDQDLEKFAGTSRHFVHFDEEPPKGIFNECKMRLIDTMGDWYITMTPVEGMTWVYDDVYVPGQVPGSNIGIVEIDTAQNPYVSALEVEEVMSGLDDDERKARKQGKFVQIGGLVYKKFTPEHVLPGLDRDKLERIKGWTHYASMDHGFNNPTCWLFHAVSPQGLVVTYDEIYDNETIIEEFARRYHEHCRRPGRIYPGINVGDPAIAQRNAQTGDSVQLAYQQQGVSIVLGNNDVAISVAKINSYLERHKWVITEDCPNLIRELQRVKWKIFESPKRRHDNNPREEIHKKDDHAPDSARYFFAMMPDLYIPPNEDNKVERVNKAVAEAMAIPPTPVGPIYIDHNLNRRSPGGTEWSYVDENLGGWH
jgi:phage terminase large subunit-like protein